jgi:hypothetical protein
MAATVIPEQAYAVGTYLLAEIKNIPVSQDGIRADLTRVNWPVGHAVKVRIRGTVAGVGTGGAAATFDGGEIFDRQGNLLTVSTIFWEWPGERDPETGNRRVVHINDVEVHMDVLQPLTTAVSVDTFVK